MKTQDFYYDLPEELIAQTPIKERDQSRLMVYNRKEGTLEHRHFADVIEYLNPGDALVINETRVIPARLFGVREGTGGAVEFLLLRRIAMDEWEVIARPGRRLREEARVEFAEGKLRAEILTVEEGGVRRVRFFYEGVFEALLDEIGQMPLPPYIKEALEDKDRYQTVYAKTNGSAAAPTAGLHFTPELMQRVKDKGIQIVPILLHVGLGTFRPVKAENVEDHHMHSEYYELSAKAAQILNNVRGHGGRIVVVGTTCVRVLETVADGEGRLREAKGYTDIFIKPGYCYKAVDALITNFHLPESTLLMLVSALMGRENALKCYRAAVKQQYRFFSFGDAMMIL